jgi:hypothetical protein
MDDMDSMDFMDGIHSTHPACHQSSVISH